MRKVLLISNHVFHYRVKVYNYFHREFEKRGYEFSVLAPSWQDVGIKPEFKLEIIDMDAKKYIDYLAANRPDVVITFLHLKDAALFPVTIYCKFKGIPVIYWNHGINLETPDAKIKNSVYRRLHDMSDAIILYSPNEKKHIREKNHGKTFVAYNTLNFEDVDKTRIIPPSQIRAKYGIREDDIILFVGRIKQNKRLDVLLDNFAGEAAAVVIIGNGITKEQQELAESVSNFYYLGAVWDSVDFNSLFNSSKVFSIPGHLGLGLNEAFFWGKPVVTMDVHHPPEVFYLKSGFNGFMTQSEAELKEKIMYIIGNPDIQQQLSANAQSTADGIANISNMFKGFLDAVEYVQKRSS